MAFTTARQRRRVLMAGLWGCLAVMAAGAEQQGLCFDFETGGLEGWQLMEGRLGRLVADRAESRNHPGRPYPKQGKCYLSTTELPDGGFDDGMTGVIESPVFVLEGDTVTLEVGGGSGPNTYVALCAEDGEELLWARGGHRERMGAIRWDVGEYAGRRLFLAVVDRATGSWGHVTLDEVRIPGRIDEEVTARVRENYAARQLAGLQRKAARAALLEKETARRRKELMSENYLFTSGERRTYAGEHLTAISLPVGGIGTGCIQMDGKARRAIWQIFNNHTQAWVPHSLFAIRAAQQGRTPVVRALQTEPEGPFAAMASLTFQGEYPFGWYAFEDDALPVRVKLEAYNPLVPLNTRDSAIPSAIFNFVVSNPSKVSVEVALLATQQNAVGYTGAGDIDGRKHAAYGGSTNRIERHGGTTLLEMTSTKPADAPGYGSMTLLTTHRGATGAASWADLDALHRAFAGSGALDGPAATGPSPEGETVDGALSVGFTLSPGEEHRLTFALTWHFPNATHGQDAWGGKGNMYANWWRDARAVALEVAERLTELERLTRLYHDTFYASSLPHWLLDRISSQVAVLRTKTCFWQHDGYFGGWEGCAPDDGICGGNCSHVWHYAQAHARLFPEIARIIRREEFDAQHEDGGIPHRQFPGVEPATDGHAGAILGAYREHLVSADTAWLEAQWPRVRKAMDYMVNTWDADEDGVLAGRQWNTLDDSLGGSTTWMGSLYLASLHACAEMAALEGDDALAQRYRSIVESGAKKQDEALFNGEYYIQIPDLEPLRDYGPGCHIDQVLGQWWGVQLGLGTLYPREHVRSALNALLKYNFHATFHGIEQKPRKFVADEDAGMQMIQWPKGGRPGDDHCIFYGDEVMTGFEYSAAAAMVQVGMLEEGFAVVRAISDRYDGRLRIDLTATDNASWGYSGNPFGDDECGKFYARAMSVWSMLLACQGFEYDGPAGRIGFHPVWQPDAHISFFTAAEGWGLFSQTYHADGQAAVLDLKHGQLRLRSISLTAPEGKTVKVVDVVVTGAQIKPASYEQEGSELRVTLNDEVLLKAGEMLTVAIGFQD